MLPVTVLAMSAPPAQGGGSGASPLLSFLPLVLIFVVFWFLIIRPQKKQQDVRRKMLEAVKRGDRVLTTGGLYGIVKDVKGDVLVIAIAENVKVEVAKGAITAVTGEEG
jgi:preprotein translocase subunit YajC